MQQINLDKNLLITISDTSDGNVDYRLSPKSEVNHNRYQIFKYLKQVGNIVEVEQVHGSQVIVVNRQIKKQYANQPIPQMDGIITHLKNTSLMVRLADCIPLVIYDPQHHVVGLIHVGWRGAIQKIYLHALIVMMHHYQTNLKHVKIYLGPAIQSCCYQTLTPPSQRVLPEWQPFIKLCQKSYHVDYVSFVINNLISLGINSKNITNSGQCTYHSSQWFSYQRHLNTNQADGRFAVIVKLI